MPSDQVEKQIKNIHCFLLDMDGTLYLGDQLLPGAREFILHLKDKKIQYLYLTNNSSKSASDYQQKLYRMGIKEPIEKILTSGEATRLYLHQIKPGARIFLVGTPALKNEFHADGFNLVESNPDLVVLGFDTTITFKKLSMMCKFLQDGLPYIATHADINCPTENGFIPDIGSMIAFVAAATGRQPDVIIGKPNKFILDAVMIKTGVSLAQIGMIGDRLYTDIAMGKLGIFTILVLSGETSMEEVRTSHYHPDLIVNDLTDLIRKAQW